MRKNGIGARKKYNFKRFFSPIYNNTEKRCAFLPLFSRLMHASDASPGEPPCPSRYIFP
jgi:hypothetical protein